MTSIGYTLPSQSSSWADLQNWQAKMKAANDQFESDGSGFGDTLFGTAVTQSQGLGNLIAQEVVTRVQNAQSALNQSAMVTNPADVYTGRNIDDTAANVLDAAAYNAPATGDVYWGPDQNSAAGMNSLQAGPAGGSNSDVYWGTPNVDFTV